MSSLIAMMNLDKLEALWSTPVNQLTTGGVILIAVVLFIIFK